MRELNPKFEIVNRNCRHAQHGTRTIFNSLPRNLVARASRLCESKHTAETPVPLPVAKRIALVHEFNARTERGSVIRSCENLHCGRQVSGRCRFYEVAASHRLALRRAVGVISRLGFVKFNSVLSQMVCLEQLLKTRFVRTTRLLFRFVLLLSFFAMPLRAKADAFSEGIENYRAGNFSQAANQFRETISQQPSSGAFQNLGNAEWQQKQIGAAVLAWEQALWLNPFDHNARNNLKFARETAQLESPDLTWYEVASGWLPMNWWAWLTGISLWFAVGVLVLPGVLRWKKPVWQQASAALALVIFLLCLPAHIGTLTRAEIGFVLKPETPLRLTPTTNGQIVTRLASGEPARQIRSQGHFAFVRTRHTAGWIQQDSFRLLTD